MNCRNVMDRAFHIMRSDFFPPSPDMEDQVMAQLYQDGSPADYYPADCGLEDGRLEDGRLEDGGRFPFNFPGAVSTKSWVATGLVVLFSLASAFFGRDFIRVANAQGTSFLLPMGITTGLVLSCYGALFIGSHLEELSARFKLR